MFGTLKTLSLRLRRSPPPAPPSRPRPLGVSDQEVEHLLALRESPAWGTWEALLGRVWEREAERLLAGLPHDDYLKQAGVVHALRLTAGLVDTILSHEQVTNDRANESERARSERERDPRYAVLYSGYLRGSDGR